MNKIEVKKADNTILDKMGIKSWPIWECEPKEFDWEYSNTETCYFLEGKVIVKTDKEQVEINKGDIAKFPSGLKCRWIVKEKVRKHYSFE